MVRETQVTETDARPVVEILVSCCVYQLLKQTDCVNEKSGRGN